MLMATSVDNMEMYIVHPTMLKTKFHMLQVELNRGSKTIYPEGMEARVRFPKDFTEEYTETISHYQGWY